MFVYFSRKTDKSVECKRVTFVVIKENHRLWLDLTAGGFKSARKSQSKLKRSLPSIFDSFWASHSNSFHNCQHFQRSNVVISATITFWIQEAINNTERINTSPFLPIWRSLQLPPTHIFQIAFYRSFRHKTFHCRIINFIFILKTLKTTCHIQRYIRYTVF